MPDHLLLGGYIGDALASWRWRVDCESKVLALSLSGDIFFADQLGVVHWLDTGAGTIEYVAKDQGEFHRALANSGRWAELLLQPVVESFLQCFGPIPPGKCLGYKVLPVFGGGYSGENRVLYTASEHFAVTGHIHEQIKNLPDGSPVKLSVVGPGA